MINRLPYTAIVAVDTEFEFGGHDGNRPRPVCLVAKELRSRQTWKIWRGEFRATPPFPIGEDSLFVAYYASAELGFFRSLGWPMPARVLDLFAEFRNHTNGLPLESNKLITALSHFGLDTIGATYKQTMIDLILRGEPWTDAERSDILDYCHGDVAALERLLPAMLPHIDLPRALLRGRYMAAAAAMEWSGVPIDVPTLARLQAGWDGIKSRLIAAIDSDYGVYDGATFKEDRFAELLIRHDIPWPRLESGRLCFDGDTFRQMAKSYPVIAPLHELRHALSVMRLNDLRVGEDGRNRTILGAFGSRTGRNQPGNTKFIFGPSVWLRGLIKPPPGYAIAVIDWRTQEFAIAAALSGDELMWEDYKSGDPYIAFGVSAGVLPPDATKQSHGAQREMLKQCVLGVQFGMREKTLAFKIDQAEIVARNLLRAHRDRYRKFWVMADSAVAVVMQAYGQQTVFGWTQRHWGTSGKSGKSGGGKRSAEGGPRPTSALNFPMQANGAEMMRIAACLATERGLEVCAPVHDAFLICAPLYRIDADVAATRAAMDEASRAVLGGFLVDTEVKIIRYPDRYEDPRGKVMWDRVMKLLDEIENEEAA